MMANKKKVTEYEEDILESYETDEWQSVENSEVEKKRYRQYAEATYKKDRRINIRVSSKNLVALQRRALEEGIPYQTLIGSILHKYVHDQLVENQ